MALKFFILNGSHRQNSQSLRISHYIEGRCQALFPGAMTDLYSLAGNPLPLWDEEVWQSVPNKWDQLWTPVKNRLEQSDALVLVTPEWAGMSPPAVKNFLLLASGTAIAHKPIYLVAVSAARGGSYPIAEIKMMGNKNNSACFIPEHMIIRNVNEMLNAEIKDGDDRYIRTRIDYGLKLLEVYGKALRIVRESGVVDSKNFPNGM